MANNLQSGPLRIKRLFSWFCDDFGLLLLETGTARKIPANHARGRYYNPMANKRNWGKKPRSRVRRG